MASSFRSSLMRMLISSCNLYSKLVIIFCSLHISCWSSVSSLAVSARGKKLPVVRMEVGGACASFSF